MQSHGCESRSCNWPKANTIEQLGRDTFCNMRTWLLVNEGHTTICVQSCMYEQLSVQLWGHLCMTIIIVWNVRGVDEQRSKG